MGGLRRAVGLGAPCSGGVGFTGFWALAVRLQNPKANIVSQDFMAGAQNEKDGPPNKLFSTKKIGHCRSGLWADCTHNQHQGKWEESSRSSVRWRFEGFNNKLRQRFDILILSGTDRAWSTTQTSLCEPDQRLQVGRLAIPL